MFIFNFARCCHNCSPKGLSQCAFLPAGHNGHSCSTPGSFPKDMCYLDTSTYLPQDMRPCSAPTPPPAPATTWSNFCEVEGNLLIFPRVFVLLLHYDTLSYSWLRLFPPSLPPSFPFSLIFSSYSQGQQTLAEALQMWVEIEIKGTDVFSRSSQPSTHGAKQTLPRPQGMNDGSTESLAA